MTAIDIGSHRELFIDEWLIEEMREVGLKLQQPVPREVAIVHDAPWEGNTCCYHTVFRDVDLFKMYYRGSHYDEKIASAAHVEVPCYAESSDGINWDKPELGLVDFAGSKSNNIIDVGGSSHCFAPFKDANPDCTSDARYKALAGQGSDGLWAFKSIDGLSWTRISDDYVITEGKFDSQNLGFWDEVRGHYVDYHRNSREWDGEQVREVMTCRSDDFVHWTEPEWIDFGAAPPEHLYTNQITPYHRAPHILVGFPKRFTPGRATVEHDYNGVSDGVFMSSRDGLNFKRWPEAFIRPGLQAERWVNRNNMTAWGVVETVGFLPNVPNELSLYSTECYYRGAACKLRRFALRLDGFASVNAPLKGGELLTKPLVFSGCHLRINYSTSGSGSVRVELQNEDGRAIEGFALDDCPEIYGDEIERVVSWSKGDDLSTLVGQPVRLRFALSDADLFALHFS